MKKLFVLFVAAVLAASCGKKAAEDAPAPEARSAPAPHAAPATADPETAGAVRGAVRLDGEAAAAAPLSMRGNPECAAFHADGLVHPEDLLVKDGRVQNAFVYVKSGLEGRAYPPPAEPAVVDNAACVYVPHVLGVRVGQPVELHNSDPTLHNVHSYSKANKAFNVGLPFKGMKQTKTFSAPEVMVQLKCDVHPWMVGYVGVLEHPYFQVTGADGAFELAGLPPGKYTVAVWHEKLGVRSQDIEIGPRETKEIDFTYSLPA